MFKKTTMKNRFFTTLLLFASLAVFAQDTLEIQTFTFDSITTRRGIYQFPEEGQFRKILMYHTLKCDPQTQHDQYPCGEWDYLTYNNVYEHTGVWDSTLYYQPSFTYISGVEQDSVLMRSEPTYTYTRVFHKEVVFNDTVSINKVEIGEGDELSSSVFNTALTDGRSQFIWTAEELLAKGLTEGDITGIKLHTGDAGEDIEHLTIKMQHTTLDSIKPDTLLKDMQTVYYNSYEFTVDDWNNFNFFEAFDWDGGSNIAVELSFENTSSGEATQLACDLTNWNSGISVSATDYAIDLDGQNDFLMSPEATYFNSNFTVEVWLYKRNNNTWSRVFDFGNGPNQSNVIMALSNGNSGKLSFHINNLDGSKSMISPEPLPVNQWVHVTIRLTAHIGWMYIDGVQETVGLLQQPDDIEREINYTGKSNWKNDKYADVMINEFRIFNYAKEPEDIRNDYNKSIADPQSNTNLVAYYKYDEGEGEIVSDHSSNEYHAQCYGMPKWFKLGGSDLYLDFQQNNLRPKIIFEQIESSDTNILSEAIDIAIEDASDQFILYYNPEDPSIPSDTILTFQGGYHYIYHCDTIVDSIYFDYDTIMYKEMFPYYGEPFEIINTHEIGRFITPYGINLDLGPQGFTWVFDVTDYAHLLKGDVDLSAGNQQELIDLRFELIEGIPPRDVLSYDRIWGKRRSYKYKNLDDDVTLSSKTMYLLPEAETFKVKTRLTGHGHYSNNGEYPHCCEWKDNTHYLYVNGEEIADWLIFQYNECAWNAVFPQGGTWPGAREGWCPGDRVAEHEFEITDYVAADSVILDYGITPVPPDNQGMGNGNYHIAMHLFQYDEANHETDVEIYDVISPNDYEYYSRVNPICMDPKIKVRNNGTEAVNSLVIDYGISSGGQETYNWTGNIAPNEMIEITLPIPDLAFWFGDNRNLFDVCISQPNGQTDEYPDNNCYQTHFVVPDMYNETMILELKTNHQAYRYSLTVTNLEGDVVLSMDTLQNDTVYYDTLNVADGCYTIELLDIENMGLSYWAYPAQGSGYFRILNSQGGFLKNFQSEFGRSIRYSFHLGEYTYIKEPNLEELISVYPNPANKKIYIRAEGLNGTYQFKVVDIIGRSHKQSILNFSSKLEASIEISQLPEGIYMVIVEGQNIRITEKVVVRH